jgi:hypothetical protein
MRAVPVPPIPAPFDQLGSLRFSFYPPIASLEHNEWIFRSATWDEVRVVNTKTADEIWVPRRFIGAVSLGEPVVIVGLLKELEYKEGVVLPMVRRVIEMPRAVNDSPRPRIRAPRPEAPAPVVGIRLESSRRRSRVVLGVMAAGLLVLIPIGLLVRDGFLGSRPAFAAPTLVDLPFSAIDDYSSIVRRLGPPAHDRTRKSGGVEYRRLTYPAHGFTLILKDGFYAGALDPYGRVIHYVRSFK